MPASQSRYVSVWEFASLTSLIKYQALSGFLLTGSVVPDPQHSNGPKTETQLDADGTCWEDRLRRGRFMQEARLLITSASSFTEATGILGSLSMSEYAAGFRPILPTLFLLPKK